MHKVKRYAYWIIFAMVLCATNGVYSYEEHWQGDRRHCFVDNEINGTNPVTFSAAGWPWCFYQRFHCNGSESWIAWDFWRLLGNIAFWIAIVLFIVLLGKQKSKSLSKREPTKQNAPSILGIRQWSLADLLVLFALVASGLGFVARIKARYAESQSLVKEIKLAGGTISEGYYLPSIFSLFSNDIHSEMLKPLNRILQVSLDNPSKALLQKVVALPRLKSLRISGCGEYLSELQSLRHNPNLSDLRISGCKLDRPTVELLSCMKSLQSLNLMHTNITADGMTVLGKMPRLRFVHLGHTDVELTNDTLEDWMASVRYLHLPRPKMGSSAMFKLNGWPELQEVRCYEYDELINSAPVQLSVKSMPKLQTIALERMQRFDLELADLPQLREISARDSQVVERAFEKSVIPSAIWIRQARLSKLGSLRLAKFFVRDFSGLQVEKCSNLECEAVWGQSAEQRWSAAWTDNEIQTMIAGIGNSTGITDIKLTGLPLDRLDITPIKNCSSIKKLEVAWGTPASKLVQLSPLPSLRELRISPWPMPNNGRSLRSESWVENTNVAMSELLVLWPNLRKIDTMETSEKTIHLESHPNLETAAHGNWHLASSVKLTDLPRFSDIVRVSPQLETVTVAGTPNLRGLQTVSPWPDGASIEGLSNLELFSAGGDKFQDRDFEAIATSREIISLTIAYSGMTSTGLKGIGKFRNMETLILSGSDVDDSTIREWPPLHKLRVLMLDRTKITDESISWLLGLKALQHLSVDAKFLSNLSQEQISKLSTLQSISIHGKSVSPLLISEMANWKMLSMVRFDSATLDADMLKKLAACLSIRTFDFFQCDVSHDGMHAFVDAHPSYYSMNLVGTTVSETLKSTLTAAGRLSENSNQYWWNPRKVQSKSLQDGVVIVNGVATTLNSINAEGNLREGVQPNRFLPKSSLEGK
jgi:Leucine-rich repeat (LRR) protein